MAIGAAVTYLDGPNLRLVEPIPEELPELAHEQPIKLYGDALLQRFDDRHRAIEDSLEARGFSFDISDRLPDDEAWFVPDYNRYAGKEPTLNPATFVVSSVELEYGDGSHVDIGGIADRLHEVAVKNSHSLRVYPETHSYNSFRRAEATRPRGLAKLREFGKKIMGVVQKPQYQARHELPKHRKRTDFKFPSNVVQTDRDYQVAA